jgi:hypothetical protein
MIVPFSTHFYSQAQKQHILEAKGKQRDVLFASGIRTISELQRLERQQRNNVIRAIKRKEGVTIRQLARIAKDIQKCNPSK